MSSATTHPSGPPEAGPAAPPRAWWRRPRVVAAAIVVAAFVVVLNRLGTRRLRFAPPETFADPDLAFDPAFAWALLPQMLNALTVTAWATVAGFAVAAVFGLFLALGRRSSVRWIRWPFAAFIEFVRSTPLLVQLFFVYFALPDLGIRLSPIHALILGLGIHYGTYCSEAYRAGINSVPEGQWEAATALSLGPVATWTRVILPQAVPNVLPALGNFLVAAFKDAPLGISIQVTGVLAFANSITGRAFRPVEPFLLIGVGFLLVSIPAAWLVRRLEARIGYERT